MVTVVISFRYPFWAICRFYNHPTASPCSTLLLIHCSHLSRLMLVNQKLYEQTMVGAFIYCSESKNLKDYYVSLSSLNCCNWIDNCCVKIYVRFHVCRWQLKNWIKYLEYNIQIASLCNFYMCAIFFLYLFIILCFQ